ncbi:hypothetical protein ABE504_23810 [Paenibacillus oryzisoli]|uniref:hypothetical protein n=1 Tax=Paenibacillus oryzisoli TaxID=1850517 RepID=UPI003D2CDCBA
MINVYEDDKIINEYLNRVLITQVGMFIEFASNLEFEDIYAEAFPLHLRNKPEYCLAKLNQLNEFLIDSFLHDVLPLDEYIIYNILDFMNEALDSEEEVNILENERNKFVALKKPLSQESVNLIHQLDSINQIIGFIFEDIDFLDVGSLFQCFIRDPKNFQKFFHVDLDLYQELMPDDIKQKYQEIKRDLYSQQISVDSKPYVNFESKNQFIIFIRSIMEKFTFYVTHKKLYKLINSDEKKFSEKEFQILFGFYLEISLRGFDLDISPETDTGRGLVDFKISCGKNYRALIEFKLDTNSNLEKGIDYQLPLYQHVTNIDYGVYSIVCFDDKSYNRNEYFRKKAAESSDKYNVCIEYFCIDARDNKKSASNAKNDNDMQIKEFSD